MRRSFSHCRGFTLLELSIVLAIIGVVLGSGLTIFLKYTEKSMRDETAARMQALDNALLDYRRAHDRIPCPADITLAQTVANFGMEAATQGTCTGGSPAANFGPASTYVVAGGVPTKTLRLPDEYAFDGWGRRIYYAVDKRYTANSGFTTNSISASSAIAVKYDDTAGTKISAAGDTATFIGSDAVTSGNWLSAYGTEGFNIINDTVFYPGYTAISVTGNDNHAWAASSADSRALVKASDHTDRIAGAWYQSPAFTVSVNNTDIYAHKITFYMLDWDGSSRSQTIDVVRASDNVVLDTRTVSASFNGGIYYSWYISGNVKFNFTQTGADDSTISGIFIDPSGADSTALAVYLLVSAGENGHGAYPRNGGSTRVNMNITNTSELANCHCTSAAVTAAFDNTFYDKRYSENSASVTDTYDDMVLYKERKDMRGYTE